MLMTERTPAESIRPYKSKLLLSMRMKEEDKQTRQDLCEQTLELRKRAYDRVKILVEVYHDTEFRLEYGNRDDAKLGDILDVYVDDLGYKFHDLRVMLQEFSDREDWAKIHRADMKQHVDNLGKKAPEDSKPPVVRIKQADLKRQLAEAETLRKHEAAKRIAAERRLEEIQRRSQSSPIPQYEPKPHSNGTNGHSKPPLAHPVQSVPATNGCAVRREEREPYTPRGPRESDVVNAKPIVVILSAYEHVEDDLDEVWMRAIKQHNLTSAEVYTLCGKLHEKYKSLKRGG